jgi:hypothetical protein
MPVKIVMQNCELAFVPRDDGGKVLIAIDPLSGIGVELPLPPQSIPGVAEHLTMPNDELQAKIDLANAQARIAIAGAHDLDTLKKKGLDPGP